MTSRSRRMLAALALLAAAAAVGTGVVWSGRLDVPAAAEVDRVEVRAGNTLVPVAVSGDATPVLNFLADHRYGWYGTWHTFPTPQCDIHLSQDGADRCSVWVGPDWVGFRRAGGDKVLGSAPTYLARRERPRRDTGFQPVRTGSGVGWFGDDRLAGWPAWHARAGSPCHVGPASVSEVCDCPPVRLAGRAGPAAPPRRHRRDHPAVNPAGVSAASGLGYEMGRFGRSPS